jgi:hypothetical protein
LPEPNVLESKASRYLVGRCGSRDKSAARPVSNVETARVRRNAVIWAVISGVVSGAIIGGTEAWLRLVWQGGITDWPFRQQLPYWAGFYAFVGIVTIIEMAFLYWNALDATAKINALLGEPLEGDNQAPLLSVGLARAALESPNPHHVVHGVDPYALMPRWRLIAQNLLYKVKVGASSFVIRIVMRRLVARAALRGFIPLLAIPLYAIWNAWITWRVVNEARLRALGPGAIDTAIDMIRARADELSPAARRLILQGVGAIVMRGYDAHPNYVLLVRRLVGELDPDTNEIEVDWDSHESELAELDEKEAALVLDILTLATLLAGRPRRDQRDFLQAVHDRLGREFDPDVLKRLGKAFTRGQGVFDEEALREVRTGERRRPANGNVRRLGETATSR